MNVEAIALGASTGGTEALRIVLSALPTGMPPILIVQHMPASFTAAFAHRLDLASRLQVSEAKEGEALARDRVYLAPGHAHLLLARRGGFLVTTLSEAPPISRHRPSVDALFSSMAETLGSRAIGVLLTGMGKDGAKGLLAMKKAGAWTIAQDETSAVVYGMPRAAVELGAVCEIAPLREIAPRILARLRL
ncbi:MAG: CheB methylesterase domain-containing protein [Rhodocyclaceae bacterium]|nr:CheB methylesterase domain-containing protein [Rhodocyclaceae bacterium]